MKKLRNYDEEKSLNELITENTYISSDQHCGHEGMYVFEPLRRKHCEENNVKTLEELLIKNWNEASKEYPVLTLGDFAFKHIETYTKQLTGEKIILKGNHDRESNFVYIDSGFKIIDTAIINQGENDFKLLNKNNRLVTCYIKTICGIKIMFSHFPVYDDNPYDQKFESVRKKLESLYEDFNCDINIHGHTHSKLSKFEKAINVSVEHLDFKPVQIKKILEKLV